MNRKPIIAIVILVAIFAGGGFLLWQNSQAAVKDLNATLPDGVRVVKSFFGNEYRVVNKIDRYEFTVPKGGIEKIDYSLESDTGVYETGGEYRFTNLTLVGTEGPASFLVVNKLTFSKELPLQDAVRKFLDMNRLVTDLEAGKIKNLDTIRTKGIQGLGSLNMTFFRIKDRTYVISGVLDELTNEVIVTGKW